MFSTDLDISISSVKNLLVKIYVVGYPTMGESIVVLFVDESDSRILYSCVIDCFNRKNHNETIEILKRNNVSKLNLLCWSHPDLDHTLGLHNILSDYCTESTFILVPMHVHAKPYEKIDYNAIDNLIIDKIFELNSHKKRNFLSVCAGAGTRQEIANFNIVDFPDNNEIPIQIHVLAPSSPLLNNKIIKESKIKKNELSIVLSIDVAGKKFLFFGDAENETIEQVGARNMRNPALVKIPHHSSPTSEVLLSMSLFSKNETFGCTTSYTRNKRKLPDWVVVGKYINQCKMIHYTGDDRGHICGVVQYKFRPYATSPSGQECSSMSVECSGNARCINENF